ncbi:hypothetical protein DPMN_138238 [Dreissena polymorpha]|uniref:TRAPP14 C-terminal domain-containing protein n=1 Tax=Dreissena polymorpha TaxID=45954 RepID=A0A9D4G3I6_DREPO|nr:hypothetical protein DPMN_138238 [Dreissena polymorpha]
MATPICSACQVGETMEANVHFRALRLGLYEVCKHMKVNLRYSIPVSDSSTMTNQTSPLSTQSDDPQMLHSTLEDIGGIQSNSRLTASDLVPKLSPHHKSLSFSDLGQDISDELFTSGKRRDPQSPWLQKNIRSLSAVEYEKLLLSADNFIKNSCLVKVDNN